MEAMLSLRITTAQGLGDEMGAEVGAEVGALKSQNTSDGSDSTQFIFVIHTLCLSFLTPSLVMLRESCPIFGSNF